MFALTHQLNLARLGCCSLWGNHQNSGGRLCRTTGATANTRYFGTVFLLILMLSSPVLSRAAEFATDAVSILQQLNTQQSHSSDAENSSGIVSKGFVMPDASKPSSKIDVLREISKGGALTRNFEVTERSDNTPRANLRIEFDINSARLRVNSFPLLQSLGQALRSQQLAGASIMVNGHTDSTGTDQYNLDLSFRRAQTVRDYLVSTVGISRNRLSVQGFGEGAPLVGNDTAANRQLNRRVEIERVK